MTVRQGRRWEKKIKKKKKKKKLSISGNCLEAVDYLVAV